MVADINGDMAVDALDLSILYNNFGTGTTVSQGDINMSAPGDDIIDAADAGVMYAAYSGDNGSQGTGSASAIYDPATGEIVVTVDGVNNWYIESATAGLTLSVAAGLGLSNPPHYRQRCTHWRDRDPAVFIFWSQPRQCCRTRPCCWRSDDLLDAGLGSALESQPVGHPVARGTISHTRANEYQPGAIRSSCSGNTPKKETCRLAIAGSLCLRLLFCFFCFCVWQVGSCRANKLNGRKTRSLCCRPKSKRIELLFLLRCHNRDVGLQIGAYFSHTLHCI